jgi:hypothetical protein
MSRTDQTDPILRRCIRPLGNCEKAFWLLDRILRIHFVVVAEVEGTVEIEQWRRALDVVFQRSPLLAASIREDVAGRVWLQQAPFTTMPLRVRARTTTSWESVAEEELAHRFDASHGPLARANLLQGDNASILILTFHPSISDGLGGMFFLRDVLRVLGGGQLHEIIPLDSVEGATQRMLGTPLPKPKSGQCKVPTPRPIKFSGRPGARPYIVSAAMSESSSRRLLRRSRAENTTVHGALGTAYMYAMGKLVPGYQAPPARVLSVVDLRNRIANGSEAAGSCMTGHVTVLERFGLSFWDTARAFKDNLRPLEHPSEIALKVGSLSGMVEEAKSVEDLLRFFMERLGPEGVVMNLGSLDFPVTFGSRTFRLLSLWGPSAAMELHHQTIGVCSFGESLRLTHTSHVPVQHLLNTMIDAINVAIDF